MTQPPAGPPALRVVRGARSPEDLAPEELAAVVALLSAQSAAPEPAPPPRPRSRWAAREPLLRRPLAPGPGAWRASALPT